MTRRYSPNHPAVQSWKGASRKDLNRPYRLPLVGMGVSLVAGSVVPWTLPVIGIYGYPAPILWAFPFVAVCLGCFARCLVLLEIEKEGEQ